MNSSFSKPFKHEAQLMSSSFESSAWKWNKMGILSDLKLELEARCEWALKLEWCELGCQQIRLAESRKSWVHLSFSLASWTAVYSRRFTWYALHQWTSPWENQWMHHFRKNEINCVVQRHKCNVCARDLVHAIDIVSKLNLIAWIRVLSESIGSAITHSC